MDPKDLPEKSKLSRFLKPTKLIEWDSSGTPRPFTDWILPKNQIDNVLLAAFALPYEGYEDSNTRELILEPQYEGLTNIEVAAIKHARRAAHGDTEAFKFMVERLLGKPKQAVEQTTVTMSLKEYLEALDLGPVVQTHVQPDEWDV